MNTLFHMGFLIGGFVGFFALNYIAVSLMVCHHLPSLRHYRAATAKERSS